MAIVAVIVVIVWDHLNNLSMFSLEMEGEMTTFSCGRRGIKY